MTILNKKKDLVPSVSIIVPCFNQAKFLNEALDSVFNQTLENWECIIINDGSSDQTEEVALHWQNRDCRFKYFFKENGGLSSARNLGLRKAIGKYCCFLDSDDYIDHDFCEKLFSRSEDLGADVSMSSMVNVFEDGRSTNKPTWIAEIINQFCTNIISDVEDRKKIIETASVCNKLFLREFLIKNNMFFYEGLFWEDNPLVFMTSIKANKIGIVRDTSYHYRIQQSGITCSARNDRKTFDIFKIMHKLRVFSETEDLSNMKGFENFYYDFVFRTYLTFFVNRVNKKFKKEFYIQMKSEFLAMDLIGKKYLSSKYKLFSIIKWSNYRMFNLMAILKNLLLKRPYFKIL